MSLYSPVGKWNVERALKDGSTFRLGTVYWATDYTHGDGYRFVSGVAAHKSGRVTHAAIEKAIPRWCGYASGHCRLVPIRKEPE